MSDITRIAVESLRQCQSENRALQTRIASLEAELANGVVIARTATATIDRLTAKVMDQEAELAEAKATIERLGAPLATKECGMFVNPARVAGHFNEVIAARKEGK